MCLDIFNRQNFKQYQSLTVDGRRLNFNDLTSLDLICDCGIDHGNHCAGNVIHCPLEGKDFIKRKRVRLKDVII